MATDADANDSQVPAEGKSIRLLVVDDNSDAADAFAMLLGFQGHQVQTAYSGEDALVIADHFTPTAVFCDIGLPGIDGCEVAARLRADSRHAGIILIAITGWGSADDLRVTQQAGFDFHLVKPINLKMVSEILARLSL